MVVEALFALLRAPYPDSVFDEPFDDERRFVGDTTDTVEHKNKQNIELALAGKLFYRLYPVAVLGADLVTGNAVLLFLEYDVPAHLLGEAVTRFSLHRDIRFVIRPVVYLLVGGYAVKTANSVLFHNYASSFVCRILSLSDGPRQMCGDASDDRRMLFILLTRSGFGLSENDIVMR